MSEAPEAVAGAEMPGEQASDLARILAGAEAPERGAQAQVQNEQQQDIAQQVQETAMLIEFAWDLVGGMLPERLAAKYGADQRARIAESGTMLAIKRGWSIAEFMKAWGAEIAFAGALVGPAVPLVVEWVKRPKEGPQAKPVPQVEAQPEQATNSGKTVIVGTA